MKTTQPTALSKAATLAMLTEHAGAIHQAIETDRLARVNIAGR